MMQKSNVIKVGLLTVVSLSLLFLSILWLRGRGLSGGQVHTVIFQDVDGVREGAPVQMMGIRVGFVDEVVPVTTNGTYGVRVRFTINREDLKIPQASHLSIEQSGLIGEKFLEISPPALKSFVVMIEEPHKKPVSAPILTLNTGASSTSKSNPPFADIHLKNSLGTSFKAGLPILYRFIEGTLPVGEVSRVETILERPERHQRWIRVYYRITKPGFYEADSFQFKVAQGANNSFQLVMEPTKTLILVNSPRSDQLFTVENPLRMSRFLEIQLESAEALKVTNEKIGQLLSDDTIATLNKTLINVKQLTAKATQVLDSAYILFAESSKDLELMVKATNQLSENINSVSTNLNEIIGDKEFKQDVISTTQSISETTEALSSLINDPSIKETLTLTRSTSKDVSEMVQLLKQTAQDKDLQNRLDVSLNLLQDSLAKMSRILGELDTVSSDKDKQLHSVVKDAKETTENLKLFSEKLNKRFLLFRLLF